MSEPLISVIMSTYNESIQELSESISSVLNQTYHNIEFIIICDNPNNNNICMFLNQIKDSRVRVFVNEKNQGLVCSLNRALAYCNGDYIARMDADDICVPTRLTDELRFLIKTKCDLVGSFVELIDEKGKTIQREMRFPTTNKKIKYFMRFGSCICHPSWLVRKEVYTKLNGYRNVPHCEDYDFISRAILSGYTVGNISKIGLKYRIRQSGISKSNSVRQFLMRDYIAKCYKKGSYPSQSELDRYYKSELLKKEKKMKLYVEQKALFKEKRLIRKMLFFPALLINSFFWKDLIEKLSLLARERI